MKQGSEDVPGITQVLGDITLENLSAEFSKTLGSPANRVLEILNHKSPELLDQAPLILALCELYHQRRMSNTSGPEERLKRTVKEVS